ncbi:MAG: response regulator, partial [Patescibacteria group bacterium]
EIKKEKTILIIEDETTLLDALCDKLASEGFKILRSKNGKEGLEIALREHPDLILLDIILPVMDGMTMLEKLRAENEWGKNARVIILTNLSEVGKIASDSLKNEVYKFLLKTDWKLEDIVIKIRRQFA